MLVGFFFAFSSAVAAAAAEVVEVAAAAAVRFAGIQFFPRPDLLQPVCCRGVSGVPH